MRGLCETGWMDGWMVVQGEGCVDEIKGQRQSLLLVLLLPCLPTSLLCLPSDSIQLGYANGAARAS
eukprot:365588-Chlamydomonas_euryale.AAC.1